MSSVVVHYGELTLKGRNRPWFTSMLVRTIGFALRGLDVQDVRPVIGRIVIRLGPDGDRQWDEIRERLSRLPGIGNFARATHVAPDLSAMADAVAAEAAGRSARSFRVTARRADKRFQTPSPEIERTIGRRVQDVTGWPVNLEHPDVHIRIEVLSSDAFFHFSREPGAGGLPVGTSGSVMALLSGGIDSPVAAWRLMRRGCRAHFVHFHSYPILSSTSQEKARELVRLLTRFQLRSRLLLVPFGAIQQRVVVSVPPALRVVVYRRLMMRIAERLAVRYRAHALVTGDSVGQVASQTIDNLAAIGEVTTLPILRPLVGFHKEEITADAQRIGTYKTSIIPDEDCCTLFTPRYPTTGARPGEAEVAESELDVMTLVSEAVAAASVEEFRFPMVDLPAEAVPGSPDGTAATHSRRRLQ
ncbi:MAG TPA: tRNA uracil 4-sulfurtransferase ThiI [Vicinamibacterales bacterium]|nr:tRNA uracil 4-sulfurtransferase ThiI [Vicinamibacterales bacterium]